MDCWPVQGLPCLFPIDSWDLSQLPVRPSSVMAAEDELTDELMQFHTQWHWKVRRRRRRGFLFILVKICMNYYWMCLNLNKQTVYVCVYRRRPSQGECGGNDRLTDGRRSDRGRDQLQQTVAPLLHQSDNRAGAEGLVGSRHGHMCVLLLGRLHPAGQADLQKVWRPLHPHLVRHHLELPFLPSVLCGSPVQESREADAPTENQVGEVTAAGACGWRGDAGCGGS